MNILSLGRSLRLLAAALVLALGLTQPSLAQDVPQIIRGNDAAIWDGKEKRGPVVHRTTGVSFPASHGDFKRESLTAFGSGDDVALRYRTGRGDKAKTITVFLFRPRDMPEHRLPGAIRSLSRNSFMQFVWSNGPFSVDGSKPLRLFKGTYKEGIGPNTVMDYLYFAELGDWTLKIRGTLPSPEGDDPEAAFNQFVRDLPWDGILAANGECTGAACDTESPVAFDHHFGEMMLSRLLASGTGKKLEGPEGEPLFETKRNGTEWDVASMTGALSRLFNQGYGSLSISEPIYTLSATSDDETRIIRFFQGTPDEQLIIKTIEQLEAAPEEDAFVPSAQSAQYFEQ